MRKNEPAGDDLKFIRKGEVNAVAWIGGGVGGTKTLFPLHRTGDFLSEHCLRGHGARRAPVQLIAFTRVDVFNLSKQALLQACFDELDEAQRRQLAEGLHADVARKSRLRVWGLKVIVRTHTLPHDDKCALRMQLAHLKRRHKMMGSVEDELPLFFDRGVVHGHFLELESWPTGGCSAQRGCAQRLRLSSQLR